MDFTALKTTSLWDQLSDRGQAMYIGPGVFYWVERARTEADINGTIGVARGLEADFLPNGNPARETLYYLPVLDRIIRQLQPAEIYNYSSEGGLLELRRRWRDWILRKSALCASFGQPGNLKPGEGALSLPIVTPGLTGAIATICKLFLNPGDPVVLTDKRWEVYDMLITQQIGGRIFEFPTFLNGRWNSAGMKQTLEEAGKNSNKVLTILNLPHNPTGYVPNEEEAAEIKQTFLEFVEQTGKHLIVLLDDAYEGFIFDDQAVSCSIFTRLIGLHPKLTPIKLDGVSKEFLFWGGRLGFITYAADPSWADPQAVLAEIDNKTRAMLRSTVSTCVRISQAAMLMTFSHLEEALQQRRQILDVIQTRVNAFKLALRRLPPNLFQADPFRGGFFLLLNVDPRIPADRLADRLMIQHRIGVLPMVKPGVNALRITFACIREEFVLRVIDAIRTTAEEMLRQAS